MKAKGIFTHLSKLSANKKGLTLIEVIVSIGILAIVTGPFLGTIILSTRNNAYSEQVLKASELSQTVMEEIKSKPDFLDIEAVSEADAKTTDYKEYLMEDDYRVMYKIIKKEGTISSLSGTYNFPEISDIPDSNLNFSVNSGNVYLNRVSYNLNFELVPVNYFIDISEASGICTYKFYDEKGSYFQTAELLNVTETDPIKIKIEYLNGSEDIFKLNVNLNKVSENRKVIFYVVNDEGDSLQIKNVGTRPFYQFDEVGTNCEEYYNVLFKIELIVEYKGQELNKMLSYVKKIR